MRTLLLALALLPLAAQAQTRYTWVGGTSGSWTEAANWAPTGVPAARDTAVIEGSSTRAAILTENTTVARLEVRGLGVVAGNFDLTVTDHLQWEGGGPSFETFRGAGDLIVAAGATGHMADGTPRYQMFSGRRLVNDGSILWDGSGSWQGQGRLVNNGELILAMTGVDLIAFSSLAGLITNTASGRIRRVGSDAARISTGLVNDGVIQVESGALDLNGFNATGITGSGGIEVQPGAELILSGSANNTQARIAGEAVTVTAFNRRTTVTGTYDVVTTRIEGGGGGLRLDADATIADLTMTAGVLDGSGTVTVTGSLSWTGGEMGGTGTTALGPTVPLTLSGFILRIQESRTFRTDGPVAWTGAGTLALSSDATFENAGTLTSSGAGERGVTFGTFRNTGTLVHDGGALRFFSRMNNDGVVRVEAGTLRQQGSNSIGGTDTGRYEVASGARLEFAGGSRALTASAEILGEGTVAVLGGTLTNRATWKPGFSPGRLSIDGDWAAFQAEAVLEVELGGLSAGDEHDQVTVSGTPPPGAGTLRVLLADGFQPQVGDRFRVVAGSSLGPFSFGGIELPPGLFADLEPTPMGLDLVITNAVDTDDAPDGGAIALHPPAPNPARGRLGVRFALPAPGPARVALHDALGREVAVLADGPHAAGEHTAALDAAALAPGVYVVRLAAGGRLLARPVTVVR